MVELAFEHFQQLCEQALTNKFKCPRQVATHKRCNSFIRQSNCYGKYIRKKERRKEKEKAKRKTEKELYSKLHEEVWSRDAGFVPDINEANWWVREDWRKYCRVYNCLTPDEKEIYEDLYKSNNKLFFKSLVMAHRISKGSNRKLKYVSDNVFLINQFAHDRIDKGFSIITGRPITKDQRDIWWKRIANEYN